MELYFAATGPKHWMDLFESSMQHQAMYLDATMPNGQKVQQPFFAMIEPVKLYRYVFPEACYPIVAKTLEVGRAPPNGISNLPIWAIRKALNLKDFPVTELPTIELPIAKNNIHIMPLGIKEDPVKLIPQTGVKQETI